MRIASPTIVAQMDARRRIEEFDEELKNPSAVIYELKKRLAKAESVLERLGYRRCDIAACNCDGYHRPTPDP